MPHKEKHEIRDPIHTFVTVTSDERMVLDSPAFQRLRDIHQLAMTYLVYPGATHRRFEHSLGVMELASRVYDIVTLPDNLSADARRLLPEVTVEDRRKYWRRVVRVAALMHDTGHLPFSHAAEKELLPTGVSHETITRSIIESPAFTLIWDKMTPPLRASDIVKIAIGRKEAKDLIFSPWEDLASEIITGDAFGVDRIDYLLRDSHHLGVAYGRFDHYRLIDTMRILVFPSKEATASTGATTKNEAQEGRTKTRTAPFADPIPALGIERGGIQSAEALALARYYMYTQVYLHPVRRAYDIHLKDFLLEWLKGGKAPTKVSDFLKLSDSNVAAAIWSAANNPKAKGHEHAKRISSRSHFRAVYERNPADLQLNPDAGIALAAELSNAFGQENVRHDLIPDNKTTLNFPILMSDGQIVNARSLSQVLAALPPTSIDYILVDPEIADEAKKWMELHRVEVLNKPLEKKQNG